MITLSVQDATGKRAVRRDGGRPRDERALGLEGQQPRRLGEADPAHLVELVVVAPRSPPIGTMRK